MSRLKEIVKKVAITTALVTMVPITAIVGNTAINVTKSTDATKFFLESNNDINKATQLYDEKWKDSSLSRINNKFNYLLGSSLGLKDFETDFGKQELNNINNRLSDLENIKNKLKNMQNDVLVVAQADNDKKQIRKMK